MPTSPTAFALIQEAARTGAITLDLSRQNLTALPPELAQLTQLQTLNLKENRLTALSPELAQLTQLQGLDLSSNTLTALPSELAQLPQLRVLYLNDNPLTALQPELAQLTQLQGLDLSHTQLIALPPVLAQLPQLQLLGFGSNQLTALPPELTQLTQLRTLYLSYNQLTALPPELAQLTQLHNLFLTGNQLTALPPELAQLIQLQSLYLSGNRLTALPPELAQLTQLQVLDLRGNQLTALPPELTKLTQLPELYLSHNQLTALPIELGRLPKLERFDVSDNPLTQLPPEIVAQGSGAILHYLRELQDHRLQWFSKMAIVGEGGVGKTQLLRRLHGEDYVEGAPTTHGIVIRSWPCQHPEHADVSMTLNTWDFGGQEIYHATHQFFLTNRSLFILVWNARIGWEQSKLYYWLDAIQARAPESPVLLVATWTDERPADLPYADLCRKYPQIKGQFSVSNKTGDGIAQLKDALASIATALPLMGEKWPATWLAAATSLRARPEKHISPQALRRVLQESGVTNDASAQVLTRWLHELGDILYFADDSELNDLVVLKPQWVSEYLSKVLDDPEVIGKMGLFTREQMDAVWGDLDPELRQHFLRLMEKFDLSYRTLDNREVSLVVERLSFDAPQYTDIWNAPAPRREISMKFRLNTLPPGIPTWFIARSHRFTTHTHWRLGAVFAADAARRHLALVQAFPHERYAQLTVRGPAPQDFFALLRDGLELTLARYPGLTIERKIPCPGHNGQPCKYEFDYEYLYKALEKNRTQVECRETLEDVPLMTLLYGLDTRTLNEVFVKLEHIENRQIELIALVQREFTKQFQRTQQEYEAYCPNVFVLRPTHTNRWGRALFGQKLELQLYCQQPGCWHPTQEGGRYVFDCPPKWLRQIGGYLKGMVNVLKYTSPFIGPWVGMAAKDYAELIKNDLELMEELIKVLPDALKGNLDETERMKLADTFDPADSDKDPERAGGAALRALHQLLNDLDKPQAWGGLRKTLTPEGHVLWLCEYHAREYAL